MCSYCRPLLSCFAIVLLGFMPTVFTFMLLRFFPSVISSESISVVVLIDFACACWAFTAGDRKRQSLWPRRPTSPVEQAMESAAEEDKPPEYEEVIEKAPPYECVLMEDAYRTRLTNNDRKKMTITIVNECMEGAASHEIDPDLPTYEEAAAHFMIPED
ncbi:uncharacterized protein [Palaemon carinicauda]|uniref:uncharacterized protein isoform X1 n=1 Tax=Palaemon carinicauda TaxID=392227 RepID=UPI0035B58D58